MWRLLIFFLIIILAKLTVCTMPCEVCVGFLTKVLTEIPKEDASNQAKLAEQIKLLCSQSIDQENRFCYYIGALPESATYIMNEVTKPLSWSMPTEKICQRLKEKDSQICDLKYNQPVDWNAVDLSTLKLKELRKILTDWGEQCKGCTEKGHFVKRIDRLKNKYVPDEDL